MRIGIVGSRRRNTKEDYKLVEQAFLAHTGNDTEIVSGGCPRGADSFAEMIAEKYQIPIKIYYAKWAQYGKSAGFIRNGKIAEDADILIACVAEDRLGGTEDTIKKFGDKGELILV